MSVFTQIADLSRTVEAGYPHALAEFARETKNLEMVRYSSLLQDRLPTVQHNWQSYRDLCTDYRRTLAELGDLVFRHLPDVAVDLRIITDGVGHSQGELDVDHLIAELRRIRAAAKRAVAGEQPSKTRTRRRNRDSGPLTKIQQKTMEVVVECKGNLSKAAEKMNKDRTTVKQSWEEACKKLGKDPITYGKGPRQTTFLRDRRNQEDMADIDDQRFDAGEYGEELDEFEDAHQEDLEKQRRRHRRR